MVTPLRCCHRPACPRPRAIFCATPPLAPQSQKPKMEKYGQTEGRNDDEAQVLDDMDEGSQNSHDYIMKTVIEEQTLPALTLLRFPNYIWEIHHWKICIPPVEVQMCFWLTGYWTGNLHSQITFI